MESTFKRNGQPRYRVFVKQEVLSKPRANNETKRFEQVVLRTNYIEAGSGAFGKRGVAMLLKDAEATILELSLELEEVGFRSTVTIHEWDERFGTWAKLIKLSEVKD